MALSLIAFVGGGLVGLALLLARLAPAARRRARCVAGYVQLFQGTPLLMQLFLAYFGLALFGINVSPWVAAALALTLYTSAFLTEIWRGCVDAIPQGPVGSGRQPGAELRRAAAPRDRPAGAAHRGAADGRLPGAGDQGHGAGLGDRLHRADQGRHDDHQRHLPAVHRLRLRGADVLRAVLADLGLEHVSSKGSCMAAVDTPH